MSQIYLSLVLHNHQPVGNFDFIFQDAFDKAYLPLLDALERHPKIVVGMHFTGPLLDWLLAKQADYLKRVALLVQRGQVEILSGAYYEPILAMLQDEDKIGQIEKQNQVVQEIFGTQASGMWLAERIWEPHLAKPIHQAGIEYTILDDTHFTAAGFSNEDLFGYFVTEEQGAALKLVPSQTKLRYLIPWRPVDEVIEWLREQAQQRQSPGKPPVWAVIGDDGEKFGMWPMTYDSIWGKGWLEDFFAALDENADWLTLIKPGDYVRQFKARGTAYVPTAAYAEMNEWALPSPDSWYLRDLREGYELQLESIPEWDQNKREELERVLRFARGSFWRNFLVKYPEINHMQKRGLALSKRIHALPPSPLRDKALDELWASQCNCGYWHGVFGGVYLFHIRSAIYTHIIEAEKLLDQQTGIWLEQSDFNADSYDEVLTGNGPLSLVIEPAVGGILTELDYRPASYNLLNVMTRHPEGYHIQIREAAATNMLMVPGDSPNKFEGEPVRAKERGLEKFIYEDWHQRGMFVDHFLGEQTTLHGFESVQYPEQGDFANQQYEVSIEEQSDHLSIRLIRHGNVWIGTRQLPVSVEKVLKLVQGESKLQASYRVTNRGDMLLQGRFGVEMALGFDGGDNREYCYMDIAGNQVGMGESGESLGIRSYEAVSKLRQFRVQIDLSNAATLWRFPLAPISLSESGFGRVHQGIVSMPWWDLKLGPNEAFNVEIGLAISPLQA